MKAKQFFKKYKQAIITVVIVLAVLLLLNFNSMNSYRSVSSFQANDAMKMERSYGGEADMAYEESGDRRVSYRSYVSLESGDFESDMQRLKELPENYGGLIVSQRESKSTYRGKDYLNYYVQFKVPVKDFDAAVEAVKDVAEVESVNIRSSDLTTEYADAKAYLDSYRKEKEEVEKLLAKAKDIEDIIKIRERLNELQRMIDSYEQQVKNIERQTDYSYIDVNLEEKRSISYILSDWTGWRDHLRNLVQSFNSLLVFITSFFAWILLIVIVYVIYRHRN